MHCFQSLKHWTIFSQINLENAMKAEKSFCLFRVIFVFSLTKAKFKKKRDGKVSYTHLDSSLVVVDTL